MPSASGSLQRSIGSSSTGSQKAEKKPLSKTNGIPSWCKMRKKEIVETEKDDFDKLIKNFTEEQKEEIRIFRGKEIRRRSERNKVISKFY